MNWEEKPLSPNAIADDEYLASVAKDLARERMDATAAGTGTQAPRRRRITEKNSTAVSASFARPSARPSVRWLSSRSRRDCRARAEAAHMAGTWKAGERYRRE